jgi:hypothetical protein
MMQQVKVSSLTQPDQQLISVVMDYVATVKRLFGEAKQSGFNEANWAPLAAFVSLNEFKWVSPAYEELGWSGYIAFLSEWASSVTWESNFQRIHQWQNTVFLEQEERCSFGDTVDIVGMLAVYEFNEAGKICRLGIYLQHKPSLGL